MPNEIEFLDAEPGADDGEYLAQPSRRPGSGLGRTTRVAIGVCVAAVIGGLLVARAITGNDGTPIAAAPSTVGAVRPSQPTRSFPVVQPPRPIPSPTLVLDPSTGLIAGLPARSCFPSNQIGQVVRLPPPASTIRHTTSGATPRSTRDSSRCVDVAPAQCPESDDGQVACEVVRDLPRGVLAAVHARYPRARVTFAYTEVARQTQLIWYRVIRFSITPGTSLVVTLEQSGYDPGQSMVLGNAARQQVYAVSADARLNTVVDLIAPLAAGADLNLPGRLAADHRLAAVD